MCDVIDRSCPCPHTARRHDDGDPGIQNEDPLGWAPGHDSHVDCSGWILWYTSISASLGVDIRDSGAHQLLFCWHSHVADDVPHDVSWLLRGHPGGAEADARRYGV